MKVKTKVSLLSMINPKLKKLYNWVHAFVTNLETNASFNNFLYNINWSNHETSIICNPIHYNESINPYMVTNNVEFSRNLINFTMQLLIDKKFQLVIDLASYLENISISRQIDKFAYKLLLINLAQAYKRLNNIELVVGVVDKINNDENDILIDLAKNILLGKYDKALNILENNNELKKKITKDDILGWPIFEFLPKDKVTRILRKIYQS